MNPTLKKALIAAALVALGAAYASRIRSLPVVGTVVGKLPGNG